MIMTVLSTVVMLVTVRSFSSRQDLDLLATRPHTEQLRAMIVAAGVLCRGRRCGRGRPHDLEFLGADLAKHLGCVEMA